MTRRKTRPSASAAKRGAPDHFSGFKLAFLNSRAVAYRQGMDANAVGEFYNRVTRDFITKYGDEEPFYNNPDDDPPDPEDSCDLDGDDDTPLSKEEAERRAAVFLRLRTKLAQWYRRKYKRPEATKSGPSSDNPFLAVMTAKIEKAPRRLTPIHLYIKEYYQSRIKDEYDRRFLIAKNDYDNATEEDKDNGTVKRPVALLLRSTVAKEFWLLETEEFRKKVTQDVEDIHAKEVEEWESSKVAPKTPQQFHQQLAFAGQYLHPVAKAIANQMQAAVSICIIGPVADRNGEVEVRSVHVNWPGGFQDATWPSHDPQGYADAEKSMAAYGRANFSAAECASRALPTQTEDQSKKDTTNADGTTSDTIGQGLTPSPPSPIYTSPLGNLGSLCSGSSQILPSPSSPSIPVPSPPVSVPAPAHVPSPATSPTPAPTTTDIGEESNFANLPNLPSSIRTREASVPIDPALLDESYPRLTAPSPQREESPFLQPCPGQQAVRPESHSTTINEIDPVLPPSTSEPPPAPTLAASVPPPAPTLATSVPLPASTPVFNFDYPPAPLHSPNSTPVITRPPVPSDWPEHMINAYRYFTEDSESETGMRDWGVLWLKCLQAFIDFQQRAGFPDVGPSLPASTGVRPREIASWMKFGRRWKDVELDDAKRFGQQWWDWWHSLQPNTRARRYQNRSTPPMPDMDWSRLQKPGRNGFLLFMVSLVWWGKASNQDGMWLAAIVDVTDVLICMKNAPEHCEETLASSPLGGSSAANVATPVALKQSRRGEPLNKRQKFC